jgi:hypothetical protein
MNETFDSLRLDAGIARTHVGSTLIVLKPNGEVEDPLVGLQDFARLIVKECIVILEEAAEDIDNGDIFRDQELLNKFEERWSAGLYYAIEKIKERFEYK